MRRRLMYPIAVFVMIIVIVSCGKDTYDVKTEAPAPAASTALPPTTTTAPTTTVVTTTTTSEAPTTVTTTTTVPSTTTTPFVPPPTTPPSTLPPTTQSSPGGFLACVRGHESGGNYAAVNPSSGAGGAYQFLPSTWRNTVSYAGRPDLLNVLPQNAAPADQDAMATVLLNWQGRSPWNGTGC